MIKQPRPQGPVGTIVDNFNSNLDLILIGSKALYLHGMSSWPQGPVFTQWKL